MDLLVQHGAQRLIHLGDVGTVEVIDQLVVVPPGSADALPAHLVFGNVDWDAASLQRYAQAIGVRVDHPVGRLDLEGGRRLVFMHGDDAGALAQALAQGVTYLCHGHSHRQVDERRGATRVINPGALFRAAVYSVALLDTQADTVDFLDIPER